MDTTAVEPAIKAQADQSAVSEQIAAALNESNVDLVRKVVQVIGPERAQAFLDKTLAIEANGGLLLEDGSRRRTPGGVFFHTVRNSIPVGERKRIWPWTGEKTPPQPRPPKAVQPQSTPPAPEPIPALPWDQALTIARKLQSAAKGEATVKLTLIGRPKQLGRVQTYIVCLIDARRAPALPKGLPIPPADPQQTIAACLTEKQWHKVEASLQTNPTDELIIEGWPYYDPPKRLTVLLAQSVTTKLNQRNQQKL